MNEHKTRSATGERQSAIASVGINWEKVKQRLNLTQQSLIESERVSPEQAKEIMDARARRLARVPERTPDTSELLEVMTFTLVTG